MEHHYNLLLYQWLLLIQTFCLSVGCSGCVVAGCESHISLAKNHVAGYGSIMALILVDMIAKQILRELGVDKVRLSLATSKIFFIRLSHWLPT